MTDADFRDSGYRAELRDLVLSPAYVLAKRIVLDELSCRDADTNAPEIASVRILSERFGYEKSFEKLELLASPNAPQTIEPESDFGAVEEARKLAGMDLPPPFTTQ